MPISRYRIFVRARLLYVLVASSSAFISTPARAAEVYMTPSLQGDVAIKPWKDFRDDGVVKQRHDYSCGAGAGDATQRLLRTERRRTPSRDRHQG